MLQQAALLPILERAAAARWWIEMETAATIAPDARVVSYVSQFNASPKLENSGNPIGKRYRPKVLEAFQSTNKVAWKFVVEQISDLDEIAGIVEAHSLDPVYIMPEGVTRDVITARSQEFAEEVLSRGWNFTTRLHILLYGDRRGV